MSCIEKQKQRCPPKLAMLLYSRKYIIYLKKIKTKKERRREVDAL